MYPYQIRYLFTPTELKNLHNEEKNALQETHAAVESALKVLQLKQQRCSPGWQFTLYELYM